MSQRRFKPIALAIALPVVLTETLEVALRVLPIPVPPWPETSPTQIWITDHGLIFVLISIAIGSIFLFRAFRTRYAVLMLVAYVPLMVLLIQLVGLAVAGLVFNDYL